MKIIRAKDYKRHEPQGSQHHFGTGYSQTGFRTRSGNRFVTDRIYEQLIKWYNKGDVDFGGCTTFNLDEYRGLTPDHDQSYHYFMHKTSSTR